MSIMHYQHLVMLQEFHSMHSVNVHYPPSAYMADSTRKSVVADLPGLRLAKHIALVRSRPASAEGAASPFGPQTNRLNLRLHNKVGAHNATAIMDLRA